MSNEVTFKELEAQRLMTGALVRHIKHPEGRDRCASECANALNAVFGEPPRSNSADADASDLRNSGFKQLPAGLNADEAANVYAFFSQRRGPSDEGGRYYHSPADIAQAPHLIEFATSETALSLAADYLGTWPTLAALLVWWTDVPERYLDDQVFHRDCPDVRFCKLFIYLSDVGEEDGPHEFVLGSHRWDVTISKLKASGIVSKEQVLQSVERLFTSAKFDLTPLVDAVFKGDVLSITGPAGTTFVEDTYAIHRARPPAPGKRRLVCTALYAINLDKGNYPIMAQLRDAGPWKHRVSDNALAQYAVRHWAT